MHGSVQLKVDANKCSDDSDGGSVVNHSAEGASSFQHEHVMEGLGPTCGHVR